MIVETTRFGPVEVEQAKIITFSCGMPGFENLRRFFVLSAGDADNIQWLQSMDDPAVALLIIDPFKYFKGYCVDIPEPDQRELQINDQSQALVAAIVTIPGDDPANATANLLAPIIINTGLNKARQVILDGTGYTTRHKLFTAVPEAKDKPADGEGE